MKKTFKLPRITTVDLEVDLIEKPFFFQVWNYREIVGIFPTVNPEHKAGAITYEQSIKYDCFIINAIEPAIKTLGFSSYMIKPEEKISDPRMNDIRTIVLNGGNGFDTIAESTFFQYYNETLEKLQASLQTIKK